MEIEWECIESSNDYDMNLMIDTFRTKIVGGWLIRSICKNRENVLMTENFIPDPGHKWGEDPMSGVI